MRNPGPSEVHLWLVRLDASEDNFAQSLAWLSPDEIDRAERFRFPRHRRAFVLGRAALRALLASYLGVEPAGVHFAYGSQGKPALADAACALRFNASNSNDLAACAFTTGCEIGIDIEQHRPLHNLESIADRFFAPEEAADLRKLPEADKTSAFFHCWTRKEAYIKAMGGGLSIPLDSFQVTLQSGVAARMVSLEGSTDRARAWTLHDFDPAPEYAGAIAYRDAPRSIRAGTVISIDELLRELVFE
jgi:4'-phosphopantetheinyl transferase